MGVAKCLFAGKLRKLHGITQERARGEISGGILLSIALALDLAACAPAPMTNGSLESARAAVQSAGMDVNVSLYAAPDLRQAKLELQMADAAAAEHNMAAVDQHAQLATRCARLALLYGVAKAYDARLADGRSASQD